MSELGGSVRVSVIPGARGGPRLVGGSDHEADKRHVLGTRTNPHVGAWSSERSARSQLERLFKKKGSGGAAQSQFGGPLLCGLLHRSVLPCNSSQES